MAITGSVLDCTEGAKGGTTNRVCTRPCGSVRKEQLILTLLNEVQMTMGLGCERGRYFHCSPGVQVIQPGTLVMTSGYRLDLAASALSQSARPHSSTCKVGSAGGCVPCAIARWWTGSVKGAILQGHLEIHDRTVCQASVVHGLLKAPLDSEYGMAQGTLPFCAQSWCGFEASTLLVGCRCRHHMAGLVSVSCLVRGQWRQISVRANPKICTADMYICESALGTKSTAPSMSGSCVGAYRGIAIELH